MLNFGSCISQFTLQSLCFAWVIIDTMDLVHLFWVWTAHCVKDDYYSIMSSGSLSCQNLCYSIRSIEFQHQISIQKTFMEPCLSNIMFLKLRLTMSLLHFVRQTNCFVFNLCQRMTSKAFLRWISCLLLYFFQWLQIIIVWEFWLLMGFTSEVVTETGVDKSAFNLT